jgi:hypothetical protein
MSPISTGKGIGSIAAGLVAMKRLRQGSSAPE